MCRKKNVIPHLKASQLDKYSENIAEVEVFSLLILKKHKEGRYLDILLAVVKYSNINY
jgi:hypothetical protein